MQLMVNNEKKHTKKYSLMISVAITLGIFMSNPVLANNTEIQIVSLNNNSMETTNVKGDNQDEEIGSAVIYEYDERLGAFSLEDGAMAGVYGDGEYDE